MYNVIFDSFFTENIKARIKQRDLTKVEYYNLPSDIRYHCRGISRWGKGVESAKHNHMAKMVKVFGFAEACLRMSKRWGSFANAQAVAMEMQTDPRYF